MKTWLLALVVLSACATGACQQEIISERPSNIAAQFAELNKNGWTVENNSATAKQAPKSDPNVRVIREADFSRLQFQTNFQVDDPRLRPQATTQPQTMPAGTPSPGGMPFGVSMPR
jgi:hypothetical protein